jgi:hypothetical protein
MSDKRPSGRQPPIPAHFDVRPPLALRIVAFPLAATLMGMGLMGIPYSIANGQLSGLLVVTIFLTFGSVLWRMATARFTVSGDVVVARNYFETRRVNLRDVDQFDLGINAWGIELRVLKSYRTITVNAIQKSNWAIWRGKRTKVDVLIDQLNAFVLAARQ